MNAKSKLVDSRRALRSVSIVMLAGLCIHYSVGPVAAQEDAQTKDAKETAKETKVRHPRAEDSAIGRRLFNNHCFHCHGTDAVTLLAARNLRRLNKRYGTRAGEVFRVTVEMGRPNKGMPAWETVLSAEDMDEIKSFLDTVQE